MAFKLIIWFITAFGIFASGVSAEAEEAVLSKADDRALVEAVLNDKSFLLVSVAVKRGSLRAAMDHVREKGGVVVFQDSELDIFQAAVHSKDISNTLNTGLFDAVDLERRLVRNRVPNNVDEKYFGNHSSLNPPLEKRANIVRRDANVPFPIDKWRLILEDIGALQLLEQSNSHDGSGVTIGIVEDVPDLLVPELLPAHRGRFAEERKVEAIEVIADPLFDIASGTKIDDWSVVELELEAKSERGQVCWNSVCVTVGARGDYQIGVLRVPNTILNSGALALGDPNSEAEALRFNFYSDGGYVVEDATAFIVARHLDTGIFYIDTNRNARLDDEAPSRPYNEDGSIVIFGEDDPNTPHRESLGFVFGYDDPSRTLTFAAGWRTHPTLVAVSAAGWSLGGGKLQGVAPGASIKSFTAHNGSVLRYLKALIAAYRDSSVDIVLVEGFRPITRGYPAGFNSGATVSRELMKRLIDTYPKPTVVTGDNNKGLTQAMDICTIEDVLCVGAWQSQKTTMSLFGVEIDPVGALHWHAGGSGPAADGSLKPDVLTSALSVTASSPTQIEQPYPQGLYEYKPGYMIGGGTSNAAPVAAGAVALLISAAERNGVDFSPHTVREAIISSAVRLGSDAIEIAQQGHGVLDVGAAWKLLRTGKLSQTFDFSVSAPVSTAHSHLLDEPHSGLGLFVYAADPEEFVSRNIEVVRLTGPLKSILFNVKVQGDVDSFELPARVRFRRDEVVHIPVKLTTRQPGHHSAVLELQSDDVPVAHLRIPLNVIVGGSAVKQSCFEIDEVLSLKSGERSVNFFDVGDGVDYLIHDRPYLWFGPRRPDESLVQRPADIVVTDPGDMDAYFMNGSDWTSNPWFPSARTVLFPHPTPGIWKSLIANTSDAYELSWGDLAATRSTNRGIRVADLEIDYADSRLVVLNKGSELNIDRARVVGASVFSEADGVMTERYKLFELDVMDGAEAIFSSVRLNTAEALNADVDMHLFRCGSDSRCELAYVSNSYEDRERIIVHDPEPGQWKIVLSMPHNRRGDVGYSFSNAIVHEKFGKIEYRIPSETIACGGQWASEAIDQLAAKDSPSEGRFLGAVPMIDGRLVEPSGIVRGSRYNRKNIPPQSGARLVFGADTLLDGPTFTPDAIR